MDAMPIDRVIDDKRRLFWLLQLGGWSSWAATFYLGILVWGEPPENYLFYLPIIVSIGMFITLALRWIYRVTWDRALGTRAFAILGASYCAGVVWVLCRSVLFYNLFPEELKKLEPERSHSLAIYFSSSISGVSVMLVWSALYFGIKYYLLNQEAKQRYLKAISMAHEAQLKMLRYQLNPHFLFNTLNAISTLILDKDTELANGMVMKLSRFLRYSLDNDPMQQITVAEEVQSLKLYLDIEEVRFAERLTLHFAISEAAEQALMPSLLLQPLVENSIKYAVSRSINGGSIAVSASVEDGCLQLAVADDGPGLDLRQGRLPKGGGVGLANTRERLTQIYGDKQSFRLGSTEPHGLTITICIPVSYATQETA
ncbi:MAG: two-component system LytT family sensor kinase [Glaciecola sp.]|jgi:two-component system LytT family sensor kinase|uniref:sensor histidine kinase n=2 Tax=Congregibacter sp. TaxID=2744308 RepID=UPI0039E30C2D